MQLTRPARGLANWQGLATLYAKEVHRFLKIFGQTLLAPIVTTLLFLTVFAVVFGGGRTVAGMPYVEFLAPGLIMMTILQNAFANTSTSIIQAKLNDNIVDTLMPPLSPFELTAGYILSSTTRGLLVATGVAFAVALVVPIEVHNFALVLFYAVGAAVMMAALGTMTGIWAEKYDHVSTITNFVILPLSFMSGTFFTIERFPESLRTISFANPFFYLIDGFRYGLTGHADGNIVIGMTVTIVICSLAGLSSYAMFRSGYKLKS